MDARGSCLSPLTRSRHRAQCPAEHRDRSPRSLSAHARRCRHSSNGPAARRSGRAVSRSSVSTVAHRLLSDSQPAAWQRSLPSRLARDPVARCEVRARVLLLPGASTFTRACPAHQTDFNRLPSLASRPVASRRTSRVPRNRLCRRPDRSGCAASSARVDDAANRGSRVRAAHGARPHGMPPRAHLPASAVSRAGCRARGREVPERFVMHRNDSVRARDSVHAPNATAAARERRTRSRSCRSRGERRHDRDVPIRSTGNGARDGARTRRVRAALGRSATTR